MFWLGFIGSFLVVFTLAYLALVRWDAKHEVTQAPKEKMLSCDKHGLFLEKYALNLGEDIAKQYPDGREEVGPLLVCPFCYEERINEAKKNV